jgi:hypothetical protein
MNKFDLLYKNIIESMVSGGSASVFGSPVNGEIGSQGGSLENSDFYAKGSNVIPFSVFGKIQKRPKIQKKGKRKK